MGAMVSTESIGLSEYWLVCCPPWLQARHHHCVPSGSWGRTILPLSQHFYHSSRGVWEHNYSVIMAVTTLQQQNLYRWPTKNDLCMPQQRASSTTEYSTSWIQGMFDFIFAWKMTNYENSCCLIFYQQTNQLINWHCSSVCKHESATLYYQTLCSGCRVDI